MDSLYVGIWTGLYEHLLVITRYRNILSLGKKDSLYGVERLGLIIFLLCLIEISNQRKIQSCALAEQQRGLLSISDVCKGKGTKRGGYAHCIGAIPVLASRSSTLDINQQSKIKNCLGAYKGDKCRVEAFLVGDLRIPSYTNWVCVLVEGMFLDQFLFLVC